MGSLKGPIVLAKVCSVPMLGPMNARFVRSDFLGATCTKVKGSMFSCRVNVRKCKTVHCSFNSPSDGTGSMAENFDEKDEDYVNSSVVEAGMLCLHLLIVIHQ